MKTLAITGSIGMGKSTVAKMFAEVGIPTFDADATVRTLQGAGGKLVPAIEQMFPGSTRDGAVDRDVLSAMVLGDRDRLARLEALGIDLFGALKLAAAKAKTKPSAEGSEA